MQTYETYRDQMGKLLAPLPSREQYFFGCWCTEKLFGLFSIEKIKKLSAPESAQINSFMTFMWDCCTRFPDVSEQELYDTFDAVQQIEEKDFDQDDYAEYTAKALLVAQLLIISFIEERDPELIVDAAETLIQVMEFSISYNFGHDTTDLFNHPLISNELRLQQQLIERLAAAPALGTDDKHLFRPQHK